MALGIRHLTAEQTPTNISDAREKMAVLEDLFGQLEALNIGWSVYKITYSSTSYTSTSCYGNIFLRYKDNSHLFRFQITGGNIAGSAQIGAFLLAKDLNEDTSLSTWGSTLALYFYNGSPYTMSIGLTVYFGGDDWSALSFASSYTNYATPALFSGNSHYRIFAGTMEKVTDNTDVSTYIDIQTYSGPMPYSSGFQTDTDVRITLNYASVPPILPQNPDFEIVSDSFVYKDIRKIRSSKNFSNSWVYAMGTVITINSEKWIVVGTGVILKLYDPPSP